MTSGGDGRRMEDGLGIIFDRYARYYDLLYEDKDYAAETDYIAGLIHRHAPGARTILELGSGTGTHAGMLADRGFCVHGIERSAAMLERSLAVAKKANVSEDSCRLEFTAADIRTVRLDRQFDAVASLFHVVSYQTSNADAIATLETARHHLKRGGVFIFDIWYGPAVLTQQPAVRVKRVSDERWALTRIAEPTLHCNENTVDVTYRLFAKSLADDRMDELTETHSMRYFFMPEIELLAARSGFELRHAESWMTGAPIHQGTWSICVVLQAQ